MTNIKSIFPPKAYSRIALCVALFFYLLLCYNGLWNMALYPADAKYTETLSSFLAACQMLTPATLIATFFGALSVLELVCTVPDNEWKTIMEMILWSLLTILMNSFTVYQISLGNDLTIGIWMILITTTMVTIVWYISTILLLKSSKRLHELADKLEEKDDIEERNKNADVDKDMEGARCLDERTITGLVQSTLHKIGCEPEMEERENVTYVYFTYQGEKFTIECNDSCKFVVVYDTWWHELSTYSEVEEIADLHKTINLANQYSSCTVVYSINNEIEQIGVHTRRTILFIPQIPDIDHYLISVLGDFFKVQRFVLAELEKCKVTENR